MARITIKGDERLEIKKAVLNVSLETSKTWHDIKQEVETSCVLKSKWADYEYAIYDWRMDDEKGEEIIDSTPITKDMTVYARTNYLPFKWDGTVIEGYNLWGPRGRIIIPRKVTGLNDTHFNDCNELTAMDFSGCAELKEIKVHGNFENVKEVNLTGCVNLQVLELSAKNITDLDLTPCVNLEELELNWLPIKSLNLYYILIYLLVKNFNQLFWAVSI